MTKIEDVLIINSYAGSLLLAASKIGLPIRGSYEDAGYGIKLQKANFRGIDWRDKRADWPEKQDLSRSILIAHPPCAAFSSQNALPSNRGKQGIDAPKFQCTVDVVRYGTRNRAAAIAVESVQPALEGARQIHDELADEKGYRLFRVLQNAADFGVAQSRRRFWAIFVRKDLCKEMTFVLEPRRRTVKDVVDKANPGDPFADDVRKRSRIESNMRAIYGMSPCRIAKVFRGEEGFGRLPNLLRRVLSLDEEPATVAKNLGYAFASKVCHILDPDGVATTLLGDVSWVARGRLVSKNEYKEFMGFPRPYDIGESPTAGKYFLSRGVVPAVAAWVLEQTVRNLEGRVEIPEASSKVRVVTIPHNHTADLEG